MWMTNANYSLRRRLLVGTASLMLGVLLLLSAGVWKYASHTADLSYDRLLTGSALAVIERIRSRNGAVEVDLPYAALEILSLAPDDKVYYEVRGPDSLYLTGYDSFPVPADYAPSSTPRFYDTEFLDEPIRAVAVAKRLNDPGVSGWVEVHIGHSREARNALTHEILLGEMATLVLVITLALACLAFGINRTLAPLNSLSRNLRQRRVEEMGPLPDTHIREVKPLVASIDQYRTRLQSNLDSMQVFIADASHQIRTALSGVQAQLDIAEMEPEPEMLRSRLSQIRNQHRRLSRLTNQLLTHALVAHRRDTHQFQPVNLNKLLSSILTSEVRDHADSDIEFNYQNSYREITIEADAVSLRECLRNLIDNAIKYGPADNNITLGVDVNKGEIVLFVDDSGPGIPADMLTRAVQRFERIDSENNALGSGLGLAIVKTVTEAHGGSLHLSNRSPKGLRVELRMPWERA
ncbi:sensor histidine kinase [Marinobacterium sp. YM272]|uniref:sensor histidine kinase n=1 Tax=Marinobacterium sp. YM272 TaxID=3421654 RepID=UPI003D80004C